LDDSKKLDRLENDVQGMFYHDETRAILWEIYKFCEVYKANIGVNQFEVGVSEGKRRVGLYIEALLSVIPPADLARWKVDCAFRDKAQDEQDVSALHDILGEQFGTVEEEENGR